MQKIDIIIIGAGASGIFCATQIAKRNKSCVILEHNETSLKKVLISGGGRCNFTNLSANKEHYQSSNLHFVQNVLNQFKPTDFLEFIESNNIKYVEKAKGQFFTKNGSKEIISALKKEIKNIRIEFRTQINSVSKDGESFLIQTNKGSFNAKSLIIATGGMSYQNLGASDLGYKIAKQFGLKIIPYSPALVPLNLDSLEMKEISKLQGISVYSKVSCDKKEYFDNILFTHFGLSGPAILQSSLYWNKGKDIFIDLLPTKNMKDILKNLRESSRGKKISHILQEYFPKKLIEFIIGDKDIFISEASNNLIDEISKKINAWRISPVGTKGYSFAEATSGGIDLDEMNQQTMESKKIDNLYFIGEVLDATGEVGGFNLQWAWSTGYIAGKNA